MENKRSNLVNLMEDKRIEANWKMTKGHTTEPKEELR